MRFDIKAAALADLESIYAYGLSEYGIERAESYLAGIREQFDRLIAHPRLGPVVPGLSQSLRVWRFNRHHVYYRVSKDAVTVIRVLHHAMNAATRLEEP